MVCSAVGFLTKLLPSSKPLSPKGGKKKVGGKWSPEKTVVNVQPTKEGSF